MEDVYCNPTTNVPIVLMKSWQMSHFDLLTNFFAAGKRTSKGLFYRNATKSSFIRLAVAKVMIAEIFESFNLMVYQVLAATNSSHES